MRHHLPPPELQSFGLDAFRTHVDIVLYMYKPLKGKVTHVNIFLGPHLEQSQIAKGKRVCIFNLVIDEYSMTPIDLFLAHAHQRHLYKHAHRLYRMRRFMVIDLINNTNQQWVQ